APCGDFNWMRHVPLPGIRYLGVDIVRELIDRNRRLYADETRQFHLVDMTVGPLPSADLLFCRDCFVHLSFRDIFKALAQFRASGARYLLTTTFTARPGNEDIATGGWRPLNLERPPFNFPAPMRVLSDGFPRPEYADKMLALWPVAQLLASRR